MEARTDTLSINSKLDVKCLSYVTMSLRQLLGCGRQSGFCVGVDAVDGYCDHLALLGGKLGEDVGL